MSQLEWEARRVACAFGSEKWYPLIGRRSGFGATVGTAHLEWSFEFETAKLRSINIVDYTKDDGTYLLQRMSGQWAISAGKCHLDLMARGLYGLGFEDECILALLPPLSAHEKLELRLSMPREFWPPQWMEEAENMTTVDVRGA